MQKKYIVKIIWIFYACDFYPQIRGHASIYKSVSPILGENHQYQIKVSKRNKATEAITDYLDSTQLYSMIDVSESTVKRLKIEFCI